MKQVALLSYVCLLVACSPLRADDPSSSDDLQADLEAAKQRVTPQQTYTLRYKFAAGDSLRWKVVHLGTTETTIQGNTQTTKSRSVSTKLWRVTDVAEAGNISLTHSVERTNMWQKLSDRPEIRYDSEKDETVPREYEHVAKTIGIPLTMVTIQPDGKVVQRESKLPQSSFGLGDMVMLLPPKPVKAGSRWYEPAELRIRLQDDRLKRIKIRKLYTLDKVSAGVATITVKTEVLTPIDDPSVEVQLVQQINNGTIKFDVDAGRVISKQMDWDETVVGFNGADSLMKYLARITEELMPASTATARTDKPPADKPAVESSTARAKRSDKPAVRRR